MNSPDISTLLSGVLSNPEMLSKIMGVASTLSSSGILEGNSDNKTENQKAEEVHAEHVPEHIQKSGKNSEDAEKRRALLYALKPFLGEKRREKIDFILKVLALLDAAESFNKSR